MQQDDRPEGRVGKRIRPVFHKTRPERSERAWRGDITGRPLRAARTESMRPRPQTNQPRMAGAGVSGRRPSIVSPRSSGRAKNVYSGRSFYVNNRSGDFQRRRSDHSTMDLNILRRQTGEPRPGARARKVTPRSASAAYLARRSTNTWAHFRRTKRQSERATTRDLAGKKLRARNYETPRPVLGNPTLNYRRRIAGGERPYTGPAAGGYVSRTRPGRAWKGDITHRAVRGGFRSKKGEPAAGAPIMGRGPRRDAFRVGRYQGDVRTGGRGFNEQGEEYSGNIRSWRRLEGGGSVTRGWNNKGVPIQGSRPGKGSERIGYSGNIRVGQKGFNEQGERYTGNVRRVQRGFGDQGEEYTGNIRRVQRGFSDQGEEYTGNIKWQRPDQGGGTRSGRHWNNNNRPVLVRTPPGKSAQVAGYKGNIRGGKTFNDQGEEYTGNIRLRRSAKGGGSVSGKVWNNEGRPIEGRAYTSQTRISRYSGNVKAGRPEKGGGSVSGTLWNNNEKPIAVRVPRNKEGRDFSGTIKVSRSDYRVNPKSAEGALAGKKATSASLRADESARGVRRDWNYIHNPSADDEAQRTREPGRAFGRSADFQGNIRIRKFDLFGKSDLHPDAQFVKTNRNNVDEEKDMFTNFKLWWSRLFRKSETQPDHLKENDKDRKPRYDKGESGLWYE